MWQKLMRTWLIGAAVTLATPEGALRAETNHPTDPATGSERNTEDQQTATQPRKDLYAGNEEPSLAELLADPVCHALMRFDGVTQDSLTTMIAGWQEKLRIRPDDADG
ncbi:hypothetical protein [Telmatospirillum siberiense]|uniref:Uncharacterized protein n=1 Tax=Telmatospirillum siberiense TaxID=382514 RepID=A0A2N3PQZ8_9PROT|nr:hypothetical protein [Telmatospirillum siberiense]PKU22827.1 hypothetical protein CWS72_19420 [Telmatospirillum siberiense]